MKKIKNPVLLIFARTVVSFGINPIKFFNSIRGFFPYIGDYFRIVKAMKSYPDFSEIIPSPTLADRYEEGGDMQSIYFQQDLFVAQQVFLDNPLKHLDIGSRTDGFAAHLASFRVVDLIDIREITSKVKNIHFKQADMMNPAPNLFNQYDSISSLHALEHFGLGRYGDPIDIDGHVKAINNIFSILKPGGKFYFSTPIGPQRIEFNAHRVFDMNYLLTKIFAGKFTLDSFSYIDDDKVLHVSPELAPEKLKDNFGCNYGCGIFFLTKI